MAKYAITGSQATVSPALARWRRGSNLDVAVIGQAGGIAAAGPLAGAQAPAA
jgi:hypothetical protein